MLPCMSALLLSRRAQYKVPATDPAVPVPTPTMPPDMRESPVSEVPFAAVVEDQLKT